MSHIEKSKRQMTPRAPEMRLPILMSKQVFTWTHTGIMVTQSRNRRKGKAIVATERIPMGTMFPILGLPVTQKLLLDLASKVPGGLGCEYTWEYQGIDSPGGIVGSPHILPFESIGCLGASIVMFANEPTTSSPNCIFKHNCLITTRRIRKGQELQVWYGSSYDPIRHSRGYYYSMSAGRNVPHGCTFFEAFDQEIRFLPAAHYAAVLTQCIKMVDTALCHHYGLRGPYAPLDDWTLVVPADSTNNGNSTDGMTESEEYRDAE